MNMKMIAGACMCATAIVGCVSVEQTRLQLQSKDPEQVKLAEENILKVVSRRALTGDRPEQYLELVEGNELLGKIIGCSQDPEIVAAAFERLDPTKPGTPNERLLEMMNERFSFRDMSRCEAIAKKIDFSQSGLIEEILDKHAHLLSPVGGVTGLKDLMCGSLKEEDALKILKDKRKIGIELCLMERVVRRLVEITQNNSILYDVYKGKGDLRNFSGTDTEQKALQKLLTNVDKISDKAIIIDLLASKEAKDESTRKKLISKLPADEAEIYALNECKDDKAFYEAFRKANDEVKEKVFGRVLRMKDETLLADFVRHNPSAASKVNFRSVKTSELASVLLDTVQDVLLEGSYTYGTMHSTVDWFVFELVQKLDAKGRVKYLKAAKENLEAAKKDNVILCDKFYVNMPVIDYVVISFEENLAWTQKPGAVIDYLDGYADMKTDISEKDWRKEWKIKSLVFTSKDRQKYFNVKGTLEGLYDFVRKYIDKSAARSDITLSNTGWWQYNDDKHGLSVFLNDNSGVLEIDRR